MAKSFQKKRVILLVRALLNQICLFLQPEYMISHTQQGGISQDAKAFVVWSS